MMTAIKANSPIALHREAVKDLQGKVQDAITTLNDNLTERAADAALLPNADNATTKLILGRALAREEETTKLLRSMVKYLAKDLE